MYDDEIFDLEEMEFPTKERIKGAKRRKATAKYKRRERRLQAIESLRSPSKKVYKTSWEMSKREQKKRSDRQANRLALNEMTH